MIVAEKNIEHRPALMQLINYITPRNTTCSTTLLEYRQILYLSIRRTVSLPYLDAFHHMMINCKLYNYKTIQRDIIPNNFLPLLSFNLNLNVNILYLESQKHTLKSGIIIFN